MFVNNGTGIIYHYRKVIINRYTKVKYLRIFCHGIYYQTLYHYEKVSWGGVGDVIPFSASTPLHLPLRQEYFLCKRMLQTDQLALTGCASAGDCASRITTKAISRSLALQMIFWLRPKGHWVEEQHYVGCHERYMQMAGIVNILHVLNRWTICKSVTAE